MHARQPRREWLEADGRGGFASGTADLVRTRRYHALLCSATTPPTGRMVLVAGQEALLHTRAGRRDLGTQAWADGTSSPRGDTHVATFAHEPWPRWEFAFGDGLRVAYELFVPHGRSAVVQRWELLGAPAGDEPVELRVRPFFAGRDYHALRREADGFTATPVADDAGRRWRLSHGAPDVIARANGPYADEPLWYRDFLYEEERDRGYDAREDLLAPGVFSFDLRRGPAVLVFATSDPPIELTTDDLGAAVERLRDAERARRAVFATPLHRAAAAYVVARGDGSSLIAGYPWFTDWGRDTFLAVRGLCIATGRHDVARDILCEWARHVSGGMLPNRFPDRGSVAEYHTADAALWFVIAADELLRQAALASRDRRILIDAIRAIVAGYAAGTRHGIGMDRSDSLLRAGERGVQVTWMDAIVDGEVVTPRIGKPVELQALWFNALAIAGRFESRWLEVAQRVRRSFEQRFWSHEHRWACDVVDADHVPGAIDTRLRCNQVLAVGGLPRPLLRGARARDVVDAIERELLTPFGLRTLAHREPGYAPVCTGDVRSRDLAYHNGTVWPWLIGPFVEAWLAVHGDDDANRRSARERFVRPLLDHLESAGLGHVSEIFDGDAPHTPRGCPFQAWSLGELLRIETVLSAPTPIPTKRELHHATVPDRAEFERLERDTRREQNWKRWGPYLSERQWGTVREDYSADGDCWSYFPHDHARSRAYRWGEDGLLGITDRECRLCFALALWNGKDPILKERLFGLTGPEGNHGEDAKENWYYLDSTPTHSYMRGLYQYPHAPFPYEELVRQNRGRGLHEREFELEHTGVLEGDRFCDVEVEYAKATPDDLLILVTVHNRGPEAVDLHVLPQLWFRNTWSWGRTGEGYPAKPSLTAERTGAVLATHATLGAFRWHANAVDGREPEFLFTENETNVARLFAAANPQPYVKDAFHRRVVDGEIDAVNPAGIGTKTAAWYRLRVAAHGAVTIELRLRPADAGGSPFGPEFARTFAQRRSEADGFHRAIAPAELTRQERIVHRQACAGLLWSKQFYHLDVAAWLDGDPSQPAPPERRRDGRNAEWRHLYNRDVVSMPDKWEYPWYAAWDLAFHMVPFAKLDPQFTKEQLLLLLREWYMLPNGQLPAYEFAFGDVNPPVHAWACWRVYKMTGQRGGRDRAFLAKAFHKLLLNFTWWVNRKDENGRHVFGGGFLGLDNIGVFDRSKPLPTGGHLEQADGTAWMAFYCATMLAIALELASEDPAYEDVASKFFEHFVAITAAMNTVGGTGLWDDADGFYHDQIRTGHDTTRLRVRSMVGLIPLFACEVLESAQLDALPGFGKRMRWFLDNRPELARHVSRRDGDHGHLLLAIPSREQLARVLQRVLDESEFLSPFGVRSLSAAHREHPFVLDVDGQQHRVDYVPGEGNTRLFGGNSNWRGPVWFPVNFLLIEALERYHHFYGDSLRVECPTGSGRWLDLGEVADELNHRLAKLFLPDDDGVRPCRGDTICPVAHPHRDFVLFHEYFDGDSGRGCGASHQTGWTALVARCIEKRARRRAEAKEPHAVAVT